MRTRLAGAAETNQHRDYTVRIISHLHFPNASVVAEMVLYARRTILYPVTRCN